MDKNDNIELCRTPVLTPGTYIVGYRMSNTSADTVYQLRRSTDAQNQYVSILMGQNGMDFASIPVACNLIIVARNIGAKYTVGASGNNRIFAMRIK